MNSISRAFLLLLLMLPVYSGMLTTFKLENLTVKYGSESAYLTPYDFFYNVEGVGHYSFVGTGFVLEVSEGVVKATYTRQINQTNLRIKFYREYERGKAYLEILVNGYNQTHPLSRGRGFSELEFAIPPGSLSITFKIYPEDGIGSLKISSIFVEFFNKTTTVSHTATCQLNNPYCKHIIETPVFEGEGLVELPSNYRNVTVDGKSSTNKVYFNASTPHTIIAYTENNLNLKIASDGVEDRLFKPGRNITIEISPPENGSSAFILLKNGEKIREEESGKTSWSLIGELGEYEAIIAWNGSLYCGYQSAKFTVTDLDINYTIEGQPLTGLPLRLQVEVRWLHNGSPARGVLVKVGGEEVIAEDGIAEFQLSSTSPGSKTYTIEAHVVNSSLSNTKNFSVNWIGFKVDLVNVGNGTVTGNKITIFNSYVTKLTFSIALTNGTVPNGLEVVLEETGETSTVTDGTFSFTVRSLENIALSAKIGEHKVEIARYDITYIYPVIKVLLDDYYFQLGTTAEFQVKIAWMHNGTPIPNAVVRIGDYETIAGSDGVANLVYEGELGENLAVIEAEVVLGEEKTTITRPLKLVFTYLNLSAENAYIVTMGEEAVIKVKVTYGHDGKPVKEATVKIGDATELTGDDGVAQVTLRLPEYGEYTFGVEAFKGRLKTLKPLTVKIYRTEIALEKITSDALVLQRGGEFLVLGAPTTQKTLKVYLKGEADKLKLDGQTAVSRNGVFEFKITFSEEVGVREEKVYAVKDGVEYPIAILKMASVKLEIGRAELYDSNSTHWTIRVQLLYEPLHVPAPNVTVEIGGKTVKTSAKGELLASISRQPIASLEVTLVEDPLGLKQIENGTIARVEEIKLTYKLSGTNLNPKITVQTEPKIENLKIIYDGKTALTDNTGKAVLDYKPTLTVSCDPSPLENIERLYYAQLLTVKAPLSLEGSLKVWEENGEIIVKANISCPQPISVEDLKVTLMLIDPENGKTVKTYGEKIEAGDKLAIEETFKAGKPGEYKISISAEAANLKSYTDTVKIEVHRRQGIEVFVFVLALASIAIVLYLFLKREKGEEIEF